MACGAVSGAELAPRRVCVERHPLGDGEWHTIRAERHGHNLRLSVDDGDGWRCNETLPSLAAPGGLGPPRPLKVDKQGGVTVGGVPSFMGVDMVTVHQDLHDGACCPSGRRPSTTVTTCTLIFCHSSLSPLFMFYVVSTSKILLT